LALDISHLDQEAITTSEIELHQFCQDGGLIFTGRELSINHPGFDLAVLTFELHDCCHGQGIDATGVVFIGIQKIEQIAHGVGLRDDFLGLGCFTDELLTDPVILG
jgi:hypothetical protein